MKNFYRVTLDSHPAVYGFIVCDEPYSVFEVARAKYMITSMKEALPELTPYINFRGSTNSEFSEEMFGGMPHDEYLKSITDKVGYFVQSYDMYSQMINNNGGTDSYRRSPACECRPPR